jgi:SSS family solute:Na+ symporter
MELQLIDYIVLGIYMLLILGVGLWVSRKKTGIETSTEDYFLAGKTLPWWAIGSSLIAANISAEQFIGMSGSGFAIGLAIASYEWMAAISLVIVAKYFLPIFIEKGLYTIPEFIQKRFSTNLKSILAIFWLGLFIFVNLTSVLFLGAKALDTVSNGNTGHLMWWIIGLALFAATYSLYGGLSAVAWTDVVQVILLIGGGLLTTALALTNLPPDHGIFSSLGELIQKFPEKFTMILEPGEVITPDGKDAYLDLPGLAVLLGGLWVANLYYWGFNQYIIQRTLAAKSLKEAQRGMVFAGIIKIILPLIVVIPGIIAFALNADANGQITKGIADSTFFTASGIDSDRAYPWLIAHTIPTGVKGLVLAALVAAIVSSLASMLNSTATIFTMDIYKQHIHPNSSEKHLVKVGRISAAIALIVAVFIAPLLGSINQAFQYIQEYTGLVSPGILAIFLLGLFYKKATNNAAIKGAFFSILFAFYMKVGQKGWLSGSPLEILFPNLPWMDQMMLTFVATSLIIALLSFLENRGKNDSKGISIDKKTFKTDPIFNIGASFIIIILVFLYSFFW